MKNNKAFTILELLVVVAILAILAIIAIPNFIGRIDDAKASQELAEINAVTKAINTYYADKGNYPTLQGKDGTLLQAQPIMGSPHNIDFSTLVPDYLASLPHFSYWWVDYTGKIYHTQKIIASVTGGVFTPTAEYSYTLYKTNGTTQALSASYTLLAGEYILGKDDLGVALPAITSDFKNTKAHPESGDILVTGISMNKSTTNLFIGASETLVSVIAPSDAPNKSVTWSSSDASKATVNSSGVVSGVATGTATITAKTVAGGFIATCTVNVSAPFTSQTFSMTGAVQTFTVPSNGTYQLEVWGASGGDGYTTALGGKGGYSKGNIALTAGQTIYVYVGGAGVKAGPIGSAGGAGGFNGGGRGGDDFISPQGAGGGGGGASDIRLTATALSNRIIVAGGGGGASTLSKDASNYGGGHGGGIAGTVGICYGAATIGGGGASQSSGGIAGVEVNGFGNGQAGILGQGGAGANGIYGAGCGGGGGYYGGGGGGGGFEGGGGGGSGYTGGVTSGSMVAGTWVGNGKATITYVGP